MAGYPRIEELKRRVQQDPASIAFAALAEEYRRAGQFVDAIETCRAGLLRHPSYLSARVTLGRALLEIGDYDEGRAELEQVLRVAPENLAAIRALAEFHRRRSGADSETPEEALTPASSDADTIETVKPAPLRVVGRVAPAPPPALAGLEAFLSAILKARQESPTGRR